MRNAKWLNVEHTAIDLEVEHPQFGWIPYTAIDGVASTQGVFDAVVGGAAGVVAEYTPAPVVVSVPQAVTMRQARLAMLSTGILGAVETAFANLPDQDGAAARIEWEYSADVRRDWPLVIQITSALGMTDAQIDDLFTLASTL